MVSRQAVGEYQTNPRAYIRETGVQSDSTSLRSARLTSQTSRRRSKIICLPLSVFSTSLLSRRLFDSSSASNVLSKSCNDSGIRLFSNLSLLVIVIQSLFFSLELWTVSFSDRLSFVERMSKKSTTTKKTVPAMFTKNQPTTDMETNKENPVKPDRLVPWVEK